MMDQRATFVTVKRRKAAHRPIEERLKDYRDVAVLPEAADTLEQASRCTNCGTAFCHWSCPVGNYIYDWNEHLGNGDWDKAYDSLRMTNNLPEITGRLCPALCECACVLTKTNDEAVTIRENELAIIEHAFEAGFVQPRPPSRRTGKSVAVVGSGPAGLACADQLNKVGHRVVVFERDQQPGGLLRYGIPDFKLEKWVIDRRLEIWKAEGLEFMTGTSVGTDYPVPQLLSTFDAVCLAIGSRVPRDLSIPGRDLRGIHCALDYLEQSNRRVAGEPAASGQPIDARGKRVVVIGGGDTGADCVGTAHRQGAAEVTQLELLPRPPEALQPDAVWPDYPVVLKTSTSHEEGGRREWAILTNAFVGEDGAVRQLSCVRLTYLQPPTPGSRLVFEEIPGSTFRIDADLVLLAMGFVAPEPGGLLDVLGVTMGPNRHIVTDQQRQTSVKGVFAAGDTRRGQSLIVWAISEGRAAAHYIDQYLMGRSSLPLM